MRPLYLPVETHVRELDAKLLLGCVAAERGRIAYVGSQTTIRAHLHKLPKGIYVAKGYSPRVNKIKACYLRIMRDIGHSVIGWDEEGLVHPPPEIYAKRRISPDSLTKLQAILSWGNDYTSLIKTLPYYNGLPIYQTGNPRIDILQSPAREYYRAAADQLRSKYGDYILINSNFGRVNSAVRRRRDKGAAGAKLTDPTLDKKWHDSMSVRRALYGHFRDMLGRLAVAFPDRQIILRPHPAERIESWQDVSNAYKNLHVVYEGSVVPWLLGASILVQNGCTTAIESVLLDKPVIAFKPVITDDPTWELPNKISFEALSVDDLIKIISDHLSGTKKLKVNTVQQAVLEPFVGETSGKLASDRIVDVINEHERDWIEHKSGMTTLKGNLASRLRALEKAVRKYIPGDLYEKWHQDKHFPPIGVAEVERRVNLLRAATGRFQAVKVSQAAEKLFILSV